MNIRKIIDFRPVQVLLLCLALGMSFATTIAQKSYAKKPPTTATEPTPKPTPERSREIVTLLNDARLAAPELAVDTFLRVLEAKKVTDPVWRKEILDEAQRMIADVQHAMPMSLAFGKQNELNDTDAYIKASVLLRKLDRLSFQSRLISLVLDTDPSRARQMIFQIGGDLGLKPRSCEDVLTYLPDDIYATAAKVGTISFTKRQIAEGQRSLFLLPWIESIESPTQILPALNMVKQMQGSPVERQMLFNALSRSIDRNFKDDRSFTNSQGWGYIAAQINKLVAGDTDPLKSGLVAAYRSMLLKNLSGARCTDNAIKKDQPLPEYIVEANKLFPEKPLILDDVITSETNGTAKLSHLYQKSRAVKALFQEGAAVKGMTVVGNKLVKHDQKDPEWISRVSSFIDKLLAFEGSEGETETELLMFKSAFLGAMLSDAVEPGELRRTIVRRSLHLILGSPLQKTDFVQWLFWLKGVETFAPDDFAVIAPELPNQNIKVLLAMRKLGILDDKKFSEQSPK